MTDFYRSTPTPGYKENIPGDCKARTMDVSMVQGLEEHPGDLGSGFVLPQSPCMNHEESPSLEWFKRQVDVALGDLV